MAASATLSQDRSLNRNEPNSSSCASLEEVLTQTRVEKNLGTVIRAIASSCAEIADFLRVGLPGIDASSKVGTDNPFGDAQLEIDVRSNVVLMKNLRECSAVGTVSSEEEPFEIACNGDDTANIYSVAFDPLDGSSIMDCNWSVGTIFGVWPGPKLVGMSGRSMVCGGCAVYGSRTTLFLAVDQWDYALELRYSGGNRANVTEPRWQVLRRIQSVGPGKLFAPANVRAARDNIGYKHLIDFYFREGYTLRYTGGMVPDVIQMLVKGKGVFTSPASPAAPAKLRLLYEALPMAFLVERAGGASTDGSSSMLDRVVISCDERTAICLGSQEEVKRYIEHCGTAKVN